MVAVDEMEDEAMMKEEDAMMGENVFEVEGGSFYFEPNVIRVAAGEPVTIQLNAVDLMHDFVIDELNVRAPITQGGSSSTVTFTPTTPGEYEFYCSVGNHRAQGMVGTLIVE
jgi:plastocyanin